MPAVQLQCCYNHWEKCCKPYPEELRFTEVDQEAEESGSGNLNASGNGTANGNGTGSGSWEYSEECKKYNTIFVSASGILRRVLKEFSCSTKTTMETSVLTVTCCVVTFEGSATA